MFQVEGKFWPDIQSTADLPNNSTINCSLEKSDDGFVFLQLGRTNDGQLVREGTETAQ